MFFKVLPGLDQGLATGPYVEDAYGPRLKPFLLPKRTMNTVNAELRAVP